MRNKYIHMKKHNFLSLRFDLKNLFRSQIVNYFDHVPPTLVASSNFQYRLFREEKFINQKQNHVHLCYWCSQLVSALSATKLGYSA